MLALVKAQVWKYKSIEDSTVVPISEAVTVLVGKNESGKTAFLEALHKALALHNNQAFNCIEDYPRKDYTRYRSKHEAGEFQKVVELTFVIKPALVKKINDEVFGGTDVIAGDLTFNRTTSYGNESKIGFHIDHPKSLSSFKKLLKKVQFVDDVFANATKLDDVVAKIEEKSLAPDSELAVFAKQWNDRSSDTTKNGWGLVDGYIWRKYLQPALPKFLYFDDYKLLEGKININTLHQKKTSQILSGSDETALGLLELAGATLEEFMTDEGYETTKAKLEAIGLDITQKVFRFWKQNQDLDVEFDVKADSRDETPFNSGVNLYIRIKSRRHGVTIPFDRRSKGFIWFFSFLVWFESVQSRAKTNEALILLLDEPGLNLHALAQADFLAYIYDLSLSHQIVYSTHSPFMVDSARLEDVRVVEDRVQSGTNISSELAGSSNDSLFPLQAALGYSIAQNLFIAKNNVLVEGIADLIILEHMSALLEIEGKGLLADAVLVPVGGLDKLSAFISLLGSNKLNLVVLHDRAKTPHQKLDDLISQKLILKKRVFDYSMFLDSTVKEADLEDLLPLTLYIDAFNAAYSRELGDTLLKVEDLGRHPRLVERINTWLKSKNIVLKHDGGYNHYLVAQAMLPKLTVTNLTQEDKKVFKNLFDRLNSTLIS
jgi:predicted ATP-dependent endonuclease of OLD family